MTDPDQIRRTLSLAPPVERVRVVTAFSRRSGVTELGPRQYGSEGPTLLFPLYGRREKPIRQVERAIHNQPSVVLYVAREVQ